MKTKILSVAILITLIIAGIYFFYHKNSPTIIVGNDSDQHGCKPSTGYIYSKVKNTCIRVFETGIRMNPQDESLDKTLSMFVVFKSEEDDAQAEVFIPKATDSILLAKLPDNGAGTWGNSFYTLTQWKGMYTLEDKDGKTLYQGSSVN